MRAWVIEPGAKSLEALKRTDRAEAKPGPGEVAVRLRAAALNARDQAIVAGQYRFGTVARPTVALSDGAGEVTAVGPGVTRFAVGDRVAGIFCQAWQDGAFRPEMGATTLGVPLDGALAELAVFPEHGVVRVPDHLTFEQAATLPCAAVTAWHALMVKGGLTPGQWVLALGTGGVATFALQLAKAAGARVIVTSSSDAKLERAKGLGADRLINYRKTPDWQDEVLRVTGGQGADHVVEVGGAGTLERSVAAVRTEGQVHLIGFLAGRTTQFNLGNFVGKRARLNGIFVGSRAMFEAMNACIAANRIVPVVDRVFPFEDARAAYEYQKSGALFGKVVVAI
jgi:NADPH:quinone reductase-like Zn-dependent oxidoreductase